VEDVPGLEWSDELEPLHDEAERVVRRTLSRANRLGRPRWPADIELANDPIQASWQLAGIAPIGPLDQVRLLQSASTEELLRGIIEATNGIAELLSVSWDEEFPFPED
jgi:hypothetical protein